MHSLAFILQLPACSGSGAMFELVPLGNLFSPKILLMFGGPKHAPAPISGGVSDPWAKKKLIREKTPAFARKRPPSSALLSRNGGRRPPLLSLSLRNSGLQKALFLMWTVSYERGTPVVGGAAPKERGSSCSLARVIYRRQMKRESLLN